MSALEPRAERYQLSDPELAGFYVRVSPDGTKVFGFRYKRAGRTRRVTIGTFGQPWTVAEARKEARHLAGLVSRGLDPAGDKATLRAEPTVAALCERAFAEHWSVHAKPSTAKGVRRLLDVRILPKLGSRKLSDLRPADVAAWHQGIGRQAKGEANRALAALSKACSLAVTWELMHANPCRGVTRFRERKLERYLDDREYKRLGAAIRSARDAGAYPVALAAIGLLMFTGLRHGEVLGLEWSDVDRQRKQIHLRDAKTGSRRVPLSPEAWRLIEQLDEWRRQDDTPTSRWVFPSPKDPSLHIDRLYFWWWPICAEAKLPDLRIHDLRHSFASVAARSGLSLLQIGELLGHRSPLTTKRYAHLADADQAEAAAAIAGQIAKIGGGL